MNDAVKWAGILAAIVVGLGFLIEPTLVRTLPKMLHYILGIALLAVGGFAVYSEVK